MSIQKFAARVCNDRVGCYEEVISRARTALRPREVRG